MSKLMTVDELEEYLRFTKKTIYKLVKQGDIPAIRIGSKWRFDKEIVDEWLRNSMERVRARILVVDDDQLIRSLFQEILEDEGHIVVTAETTAEGLEYVMAEDFDLVFLDLKMSGTDGPELFRQMKSVKNRLPVVIITGYPGSELMERAIQYGPVGVMIKPFNDSEIIAATNSFMHVTETRKGA